MFQHEFVPEDIKHRSAEVSYLADTLRPVITGEGFPEQSLLCGPSGAGKTCIARHVLTQLEKETSDVATQYVNCWEDHTAFRTLYRLVEGIGSTVNIHRRSTPQDELVERLRSYDDGDYVVILDEVDQLGEKSLLYEFNSIRNLTMVLIANREEDVFRSLDPRLRSRLQNCARISFGSYSIGELVAILEDRVQWGLKPDAVTQEHLELIADYAAGDARQAINILHKAARNAERHECDQLTETIIEDAVPEARAQIQQKTTEKLTQHQQVVYEIIEAAGEISPSELYKEYRNRVQQPKTRRTVRNYLAKLEQYKLIQAHGNTKARRYELYS